MKLAFHGQAKYTDFRDGYELYRSRTRSREVLSFRGYKRIVKRYCKLLAEHMLEDGSIDLPKGTGTISAAIFTRRPQYRGDKFIGYGKMDWNTGHYDGNLKAFGLAFLPDHSKNANMRCFGFVANRGLFKKLKELFQADYRNWEPVQFNDRMI